MKFFKKKAVIAIIIVIIAGGGYFGYRQFSKKEAQAPRYVLASAENGSLVVSVSGSGQVLVLDEVALMAKASGKLLEVNAVKGQEVKTGGIIAKIDSSDVWKTVRDAEASLESAKISLEKLKQPSSPLSILQAENSLSQAKDNLEKIKLSQEAARKDAADAEQKAKDDLAQSYEDGFNTVVNAFLALPGVMSGLDNIFFSDSASGGSHGNNIDWYLNQVDPDNSSKGLVYRNEVYDAYNKARTAYEDNFDDYKAVSRSSSAEVIESIILETYETTRLIAEAVKTSNNYLDFVQDDLQTHDRQIPSSLNSHQTSLDSYTATTNSHLSNLISAKNDIRTSKESLDRAERDLDDLAHNQPIELSAAENSIKEKEGSLADLKAGPDELDIRSSELSVKQRQNALRDAREKYADYSIAAPFDGIIADLTVKKGDSVSSGASIGTLITKQKIAEVSLNEVDAAKVKAGQKATLSFDAVSDLSVTGQVAEVDAIGTVSQGVVTYNVKISFDTQDERIKPGMSVSASIITDIRQDVLLLESSAVKQQGDVYYVEAVVMPLSLPANTLSGITIPDSSLRRQTVEVGLANDTMTEIASGLSEGDLVVAQTISAASQGQSSSGARNTGGASGNSSNRMQGEMFRIMR